MLVTSLLFNIFSKHIPDLHIPDLPNDIFLCKPYEQDGLLCSSKHSLYIVHHYASNDPIVERVKSSDDPACSCNSQNSLIERFCFSGISDFKILSYRKFLVIHSAENCIRELDNRVGHITPITDECRHINRQYRRRYSSSPKHVSMVQLEEPHSFADGVNNSRYYISDNDCIRVVESNDSVRILTHTGSTHHYSIAALEKSLKVMMSNGLCNINITSKDYACVPIIDIKTDSRRRRDIYFVVSRDKKLAVLFEKGRSMPLRFGLTDSGYFELANQGIK